MVLSVLRCAKSAESNAISLNFGLLPQYDNKIRPPNPPPKHFIRLMSRWPLQVRALESSGEKNRPWGIRATRGVIWTSGPALSLSNGAPNDFSRPSESRRTPIHYSKEAKFSAILQHIFCCYQPEKAENNSNTGVSSPAKNRLSFL